MKILNVSTLTSKITLPDTTQKEVSVDSNVSVTENMTSSFTKVRTSESLTAVENEEINQILTLTNESDYVVSNVQVAEEIGEGASFKTGSLKINGVSYPQFDPTIGFVLPDNIASKQSTEISYQIVITSRPDSGKIVLYSDLTYDVEDTIGVREVSNTVTITVEKTDISITKTADKKVVVSGQKLTFTNVIKNESGFKHTDVFFMDEIPEGVTLVEGSVQIDGEKKELFDPSVGFSVKDIDKGEEVTIVFEVMVK